MTVTMPLAGLIVTVVIIILGIADLAFVVFGGTGSSVSNFLVMRGFKQPLVVFAFGFVAGHLFGYMAPEDMIPNQGFLWTAVFFAVGTGFGYYFCSRRDAHGIGNSGKRILGGQAKNGNGNAKPG